MMIISDLKAGIGPIITHTLMVRVGNFEFMMGILSTMMTIFNTYPAFDICQENTITLAYQKTVSTFTSTFFFHLPSKLHILNHRFQ